MSQGKRPIDRKRDSAFMIEMAGDDSPVRGTLVIGEKMYVLRDRSIYSLMLADQIDPNRTNFNLGHVQQKEYDVGLESPLVGRTLMTAKALFRDGMLDSKFDKFELLSLSLDYFEEVLALSGLHSALCDELDWIIEKWRQSKQDHGPSILLPSISDLRGKIKAFIQRAEHAAQSLLAISKVFFPATTKAGFDGVLEAIKAHVDAEAGQIALAVSMVKYWKFLRNCRHCVEHPHPHQRLNIHNFQMSLSGQVVWPSVEVVHKETPEPDNEVPVFTDAMLNSVLNMGEHLMALLAALHVQSGWTHAFVTEMPTERRRNPYVRYCFALNMGGEIHPIG